MKPTNFLQPHQPYSLPVSDITIDSLRADSDFLKARSCLIMGHPGHCLRVHGWMEAAKPICQILTDGSGHGGVSRLGSSRKTIERSGARAGALFGRFTDAQIYSAILNHEFALFTNLAGELASIVAGERIDYVVGDAAEGYSPTHDAMRLVIDAAVQRAERLADREIPQYDFVLAAAPGECSAHFKAAATWITLSDAAIALKLDAGANYPELAHEVAAALSAFGPEAFRTECLRPVGKKGAAWEPDRDGRPFYEEYGEKQVAAGKYTTAIRYKEHMLPLTMVLRGGA